MSVIRVYESGQPYFNNNFIMEEFREEYIPVLINKKVQHRVGNPCNVHFIMAVLSDVSYVMHKIYRVFEGNKVHWNTTCRIRIMQ